MAGTDFIIESDHRMPIIIYVAIQQLKRQYHQKLLPKLLGGH